MNPISSIRRYQRLPDVIMLFCPVPNAKQVFCNTPIPTINTMDPFRTLIPNGGFKRYKGGEQKTSPRGIKFSHPSPYQATTA